MSRSLIKSNIRIFENLDRYCSSRGSPLANAGTPRWIASDRSHRDFMIHANLVEYVHLNSMRKIAVLEYHGRSVCCTVGFENVPDNFLLSEIEVNASHLTIIFADLGLRPKVSPFAIKNIIEISDKSSDPLYEGHSAEEIARLFPTVRAFEVDLLTHGSLWKLFFQICIHEASSSESWIEEELATTLHVVSTLDENRIPYQLLCQSSFDGNPQSFFLALYRCLEALYAFSSAKKLTSSLHLQISWIEVATALEDDLGWHPKEDISLGQLLRTADNLDLTRIISLLNGGDTLTNRSDIAMNAARRIYKLRNSIVHFRSMNGQPDFRTYEWNKICQCMANIVCYVYHDVFGLGGSR